MNGVSMVGLHNADAITSHPQLFNGMFVRINAHTHACTAHSHICTTFSHAHETLSKEMEWYVYMAMLLLFVQ